MIRTLVLATVLALAALFLATTFTTSAERSTQARRYFTDEEIARGQRYALGGRLLFWGAMALDLAVLGAFALTPLGRRLADAAQRLGGGRFVIAVLIVAAAVFAVQQLVSFPISAYAGFVRQKAWGLTDRTFASWLTDYAKALGLSAAIGLALALGLYVAMRTLPRSWWIVAGLGSGALGVFFAFIAPLWIAPLFNTFVPLRQTAWADQDAGVRALLDRASLPVKDVLVMDASRQGRHTNAYFSGWGSSRRIVLYDTLLKSHSPGEIESILAHEIGHWTHNHIVKGVMLGTAAALASFWALSRVLTALSAQPPLRLSEPWDPAGLPLILLLSMLSGLLTAPISNAVSRRFEREADAASLTLAGRKTEFIEAEKRLVRDNLADPAPSDARVWFFASHPPALDRIAMAERWPSR